MLFTRITRKTPAPAAAVERPQYGPSPAVQLALTVARRADLATLRALRERRGT